jgi:hypothetical protein
MWQRCACLAGDQHVRPADNLRLIKYPPARARVAERHAMDRESNAELLPPSLRTWHLKRLWV